jgi:glycosyltransferase involved in cell wall biosynthesis
MPLVSVIIPAHNRETYLAAALDSVLAQSCSDLELIVVDDGSVDGTANVVQAYAQKDKRIRFIRHGSQKGAQAARNTGIRASQSQWIAFLDSDDEWLPDSLALRLQLAASVKVQVVHSECYILKPDEPETVRTEALPTAGKLERMGLHPFQGQIYKELLRQPSPMFQGLLVTKEALTRIHYLDESIRSYQEWDTVIRLAKYYKFAFVTEPTFIYNCRNPSSISGSLIGRAIGYRQVFTKYEWSILRHLGPRTLSFHYETAGYFFRYAGDEIQARRCLVRAFLWWPFKTSLRRARRLFRVRVASDSGM